jgi:hypothetical protein
MAEAKSETKATKIDVRVAVERDGLVNSWVSQGTELAERTTATVFGIARDVRGEIHQRFLGTLALVEGTQQGIFKLVRTVDERLDRLAEEMTDTGESVVLGVIRTLRNAGHGVTELAAGITGPREVPRAA